MYLSVQWTWSSTDDLSAVWREKIYIFVAYFCLFLCPHNLFYYSGLFRIYSGMSKGVCRERVHSCSKIHFPKAAHHLCYLDATWVLASPWHTSHPANQTNIMLLLKLFTAKSIVLLNLFSSQVPFCIAQYINKMHTTDTRVSNMKPENRATIWKKVPNTSAFKLFLRPACHQSPDFAIIRKCTICLLSSLIFKAILVRKPQNLLLLVSVRKSIICWFSLLTAGTVTYSYFLRHVFNTSWS